MEHEIDVWVEQLLQCKQLAEADVKRLCDKVSGLSPTITDWPIARALLTEFCVPRCAD
jgi:hypothetical protein